jgi:GDPmannose 4,6-dehydratase
VQHDPLIPTGNWGLVGSELDYLDLQDLTWIKQDESMTPIFASKTAVITGVNGQDGSYLAEFLLGKGYRVIGLCRSPSSSTLRIDHIISNPLFKLEICDISDVSRTNHIVSTYQPNEIYNLAAQSHVGISFQMPEHTAETICQGTLNLLNAIKSMSPKTKLFQASSSEMFGCNKDSKPEGFTEDSSFKPVSPYALSKTYAHHCVQMYRSAYGLYTSSGILFNHESPRRGETFVTRKITMAAARIKEGLQDKLVLGNIGVKRDWGFAGDYVETMWMMLQQPEADDFVISTGKVHTVRNFIQEVFDYAGLGSYERYVEIDLKLFRPNEISCIVGDSSKAHVALGWKPKTDFSGLARMMYDHDLLKVRKAYANR